MSANSIVARPNLSWFVAAISDQRHKIADLLGRGTDLNVLANIKPVILGKLFRMLEQVATAKHEEIRLLGAIEAIEQQHLKKRHKGWLKTLRAEEAEEERKKLMLAWAAEEDDDEEYEAEYGEEREWGDEIMTDRAVRIDYETCDIREGSEEVITEKRSRFLWFLAYWALVA